MSGRKNKYETHIEPRFEEIKKWCKRGATDKEIIKLLGVGKTTFYEALQNYSEFADLIKSNRIDAVEELKTALYKRAIGFQYVEKKTVKQKMEFPETLKMILEDRGIDVKDLESPWLAKTETITKTALADPTSALILLKHWDKDTEWTGDPASLKIKKEELKIKQKQAENENW